ncbi:MAG: hypothetical protein IPM85_02985 [Chitinophagaceae bacterium]|nr:hypothetical protein [Chitinophagaceae bacterium]
MKRLVVIVVVLYTYCLSAQSEFSARAFYTDFNKVIDEASKGFVALMGEKRNSDFPGLTSEYEVKLILPLADSGKIVLSNHARPYVLYFFEPSRSRLKIDVKEPTFGMQ